MTKPETDKPKLGWGGKRDNQNGRPALPPEIRRTFLTARVKPETKDWIMSQEGGAGQTLDRLVVKEKSKKSKK